MSAYMIIELVCALHECKKCGVIMVDEKQIVQNLLSKIESHFLDMTHTQYRHEISKKYWNKLKKKYEK